jgi:hypothetical protein
MDADDIALPHRLARQVTFLDRTPSVGILGANLQPVGPEDRVTAPATSVPTLAGHVGWMLHLHNCLNHPTVVARRTVLQELGGYRPEMVPAEDYDLWVRALTMTRVANLPDVVLRYRVHPKSISVVHRRSAEDRALSVAERALSRLLGRAPQRDAVRILRHPAEASNAPAQHVQEATLLLWRFTDAALEDPRLATEERTAIRRTASTWFRHLLRATGLQRPAVAAQVLFPRRTAPPAWLFAEMLTAATRRVRAR